MVAQPHRDNQAADVAVMEYWRIGKSTGPSLGEMDLCLRTVRPCVCGQGSPRSGFINNLAAQTLWFAQQSPGAADANKSVLHQK